MTRFEISQLRSLPQDPTAVWQGGWLPVPMPGEDEGPDRPGYVTALWGVDGGGQSGPELEPRVVGTTSHADLLTALVRFAVSKRTAGYRPARVEVCDAGEAEFLRGPLGEAGIDVALVGGSPEQLQAFADFVAFMRDAEPGFAELSLFLVDGMSLARVWSFADAAREFHLAEPWERLDGDEDPLRVVLPEAAPEMRVVSVMGAVGESFGLGFHDTWDDYLRRVRGREVEVTPSWSVTFDYPENPPPPDLAAWKTYHLPLAGDDAYPLPARFDPRHDGTRAPTPAELSYLEGLLRAIARATDEDLDSGRWSRTVPTHDGPVTYTLELPALLDPPAPAELRARDWPPDPRANERLQLIIRRRFEDDPPVTPADMTRILNRDYTGRKIDDLPFTPRNDWDRAQDLCYAAFASHGRRRVALARQALRVDPRCADAHVILAEEALTTEAAHAHYAAGAAAGLAHIPPEALPDALQCHAGELWGDVLARPHLRALYGLVQTLRKLGRRDEAIDRCREVLQHDRDDHQRLREYLAVMLLEERRDQEAADFLRTVAEGGDFENEFWPWLDALARFRLHGDAPEAAAAAARARRINRYVADYLLDDRARRRCETDQIAPGRRGDAQLAAYTMYPLWVQTEGALAWLKDNPKATRGGPTRPSRRRSR
jgi:hypothetical protein